MGETLDRSSLKARSTPGAPVNLERSVRLADRLGGHLVQGHVDGTGTIISRTPAEHWDQWSGSAFPPISRGTWWTRARSPSTGSASPSPRSIGPRRRHWFEVSLIPETLKRTTLGAKQPGDEVNLEVDVIAKYVEKLLDDRTAGRRHPKSTGTAAEHAEPEPRRSRLTTSTRAIKDIADGRPVIVVDDADRENEGDIIFAASLATPSCSPS
jgi:riboflavin synthase